MNASFDDIDPHPDSHSIVVTHFPDEYAKSKTERVYSLPQLVGEILTTDGACKEDLRWLKLARFGNKRTDKRSLRHDQNVLAVYGAEADYDGERMSFEEAVAKAKAAGILCVVYTSPSFTEDAPRFRVVCPFSKEYPPEARARFLARLNGVYGGIFSNESWTLSQSYYFGSVNHNPSHRAELIEGTPIDLLEALDATAIAKPAKATPRPQTRPTAKSVQSADQLGRRYHGFVAKLLDNVRNARETEKHVTLLHNARTLGGIMGAAGITEADAVAWLLDALPETVKDWNNARQTARDGLRDGRANPIELEDRPGTNSTNGAANSSGTAAPKNAEVSPAEAEIARLAQLSAVEYEKQREDAANLLGTKPTALDVDVKAERSRIKAAHQEQVRAEKAAEKEAERAARKAKAEAKAKERAAALAAAAAAGTTDPTEDAVAAKFAQVYAGRLVYDHSEGIWFIWKNGRWTRDSRNIGFHLVRMFARAIREKMAHPPDDMAKIAFCSAVERAARADPRLAVSSEIWDTDPMLLGTPDGVVNLETGEMFPARPELYISRHTSVAPAKPGTPAPIWAAFLNEATRNDQEYQDFLYREFGYWLTGNVSEEVISFFFGPGGCGKGTVFVAITGIMGEYAMSVPIEAFTAGNHMNMEYYRAQWNGVRLVTASEPDAGAAWSESQIKDITGNDKKMSGRHPRGRPFEFWSQAKVAILGNHQPKLKSRDAAMERRLRINPFNTKPAKVNTMLKEQLKAEYPAILRLMIDGCLKWKSNKLGTAKVVQEATEKYFQDQDAFKEWIEEQCETSGSSMIPLSEKPGVLITDYNAWAKGNGRDLLNSNQFAELIDRYGPPLERCRVHGGIRLVKGIALKPKADGQSGKPGYAVPAD